MRQKTNRILCVALGAALYPSILTNAAPVQTATASSEKPKGNIVYTNRQYGFRFVLPKSWKGYSIVSQQWAGHRLDSGTADKTEQGPQVAIRHPLWTEHDPRQDIPVMVFTLRQWSMVERDGLVLGAAPIGPSELGRNSRYVFALPARFDYAFPTGYEEVESILRGKPLHAF